VLAATLESGPSASRDVLLSVLEFPQDIVEELRTVLLTEVRYSGPPGEFSLV
jgi:hypothetical protein